MAGFNIYHNGKVIDKIPQKIISEKPFLVRNPTNEEVDAFVAKKYPHLLDNIKQRRATINKLFPKK